MEKAGKKAKKSGKPHSPSHSSASSREAGSSISGGNSNEEPEEQNYSDNGERPGFSQWVDEDEETTEPPNNLRQDMATMSFGALLKAKRALAAQEPSESSNGSSSSDDKDVQFAEGPPDRLAHDEWKDSRKPKEKRANKHAPMEMSSKRPVSRKRTVVEVTPMRSRDPRFGGAAGDFSADHFRKDYGFLLDTQKTELATLKENLTKAKKLYASSPVSLREERQEAVDKLERTLKRAESSIHRAAKEALEREALAKVRHEERIKRSKGKGAWYLKKDEQEKIKLKARFESMGGREVEKALEKKQKKTASKEKKARPFGRQLPMSGSGGKKRAWIGDQGNDGEGQGSRNQKRRRIEE